MNTRSLRFKLTAWYAGLLLLVATAFAFYTYQRLEGYLVTVTIQSLSNRAYKIAQTLIANIPATGEDYVKNEIKARYAPELNDRFIRVIRPDGSILYVSDTPNNSSFDPKEVPMPGPIRKEVTHYETMKTGTRLVVVSDPAPSGDAIYLVEVGISESQIQSVLGRYARTLAIGLPVFVAIAILGGYLLIGQSLAPVRKIADAAQEITLHHLERRLPPIKTGDEIEMLSNTLNRMIARLHRSYETSSRFAADASHELRTPLTIMRGELETLLLDKNIPPRLAETLNSLFEETVRLSKIVEGLLSLSRLDTGEAQMQRVKLDLSELASTITEQMAPLAEERKIKVSCPADGRVPVEGDPSKLKQVLVNLLDNAIKYTPPGGEIHVTTESAGAGARLHVADTGPGIPEAALAHVFDRFYRADEVRSREVEGTGLGLSIVQSICAAHGGTISVKNLEPGGCCFTVELP